LAILRSNDGYAAAFEAERGSGGVRSGCGFGPQVYDRTVVMLGDDTTEAASDLPTDFLRSRAVLRRPGDGAASRHHGAL
jgi:hypothetical protein